MKCQQCKVNPATTRIVYNINGNTTELNLCASCAAKNNYYSSLLGSFDFDNFFGNLFSHSVMTSALGLGGAERTCTQCGSTFSAITERGKLGCANCYTAFYDALLPSIRRIHGNAEYKGRLPVSAGAEIKRKKELASLKEELNKAVLLQEYERAAEIRDRIKELEGRDNDGRHTKES